MSGERVNHPRHYNAHASGVECIEIVESLGFCVGNAVKYVWRASHKGSEIEDLEKAAWYLRRAIAGELPWGWVRRNVVDRVLEHEPAVSVLADVLTACFAGSAPNIHRALARVEREIADRKHKGE